MPNALKQKNKQKYFVTFLGYPLKTWTFLPSIFIKKNNFSKYYSFSTSFCRTGGGGQNVTDWSATFFYAFPNTNIKEKFVQLTLNQGRSSLLGTNGLLLLRKWDEGFERKGSFQYICDMRSLNSQVLIMDKKHRKNYNLTYTAKTTIADQTTLKKVEK